MAPQKQLLSRGIIFTLIAFCIISVHVSCSKRTGHITGEQVSLTVDVHGVDEYVPFNPDSEDATAHSAHSGHSAHASIRSEDRSAEPALVENASPADLDIISSSEQTTMSGQVLETAASSGADGGPLRAHLTRANVTNMQQGSTYRILLYYRNTGQFVTSVLATSGVTSTIDVIEGEIYSWYAYSYHTNETIPPPGNTNNPTIPTPRDRELLFASGEITAGAANTPLRITFRQQLARAVIRVNAEPVYANIVQLNANFVSNNYFREGTFNLRSGTISNVQPYTVSNITFTNETPGSNAVRVARYYTANPSNLNQIQVNINTLTIQYPSQRLESLATPATPLLRNFSFTNPEIGHSLNGLANLRRTITGKRIVHATRNTTYGYAAGERASFNMITDQRNFGTTATSHFRSQPFEHIRVTTNGGLLPHLTGSQRPDIIIIAVYYLLSAAEQTELANYLRSGGVVVMFTDNAPAPAEVNARVAFLNNIFGTNNITWSAVNGAGAVYALSNQNDRILNGPFGDIRGLHWGEDASQTISLGNLPAAAITTYSSANAINFQQNPTGITVFKHNTLNLFWIGDGGILANSRQNGASTNNTIEPFATNANNYPVSRPYGSSGSGHAAGSMTVFNSQLFANAMAWAMERAEYYGINRQ